MAESKQNSEILTIMILDLYGYTELSSRLGRESIDRLHDIFDKLIIPSIQGHHGVILKKVGDAFLTTFKSPTNALHSAIEIQKKFREYNKKNRLQIPIKIKIGLHSGEVVIKQGDIYGDAVNIASRIEGITLPGHIFFSNSIFMAMNKNEIPCIPIGIKKVKGISSPIKIFRIKYDFEDKLLRKKKAKKFFKKFFWLIIFIILGFLAYTFLYPYIF